MDLATSLISGDRTVEIPGKDDRENPQCPEPVSLPDLRQRDEYANAACKHEGVVIKQNRYVLQAYENWRRMNRVQ